MTETLNIDEGTIAYDLQGEGPLVVLAHGMGDSRHSYRFIVPALVAAGYRVANADIRGSGESSTGWSQYERTDIAGDLVALARHLGGPAVIVGQSISGGAATIAAATAPDLISGVVELAPFTRKQSADLGGLLRVKNHRRGTVQLAKVMLGGSLKGWMNYLNLAIPTKPADWSTERARIETMLSDPDRMGVLKAMTKTSPADAGAQLANVRCPVLIVEGGADPDWANPRAEGERIIADLPAGLGELAVIDGAGHYLHAETPEKLLGLLLPFLSKTLPATPPAHRA
ncbi:alpha/beta hydrolase [Cryobacterium sp. TMT2-18-3]|uniref:alpha/beta fold hydrolase n=1 Tax=unclassified Cryobacterium TaxID=2649013 RepID=UPI00106C4FA3|nr:MULTISPECIES: alpha/beta hydrolase [unclassified Cryobacterium]TFC29191.1 alpha/beta hydrolase [Cryobacterium sp. TMT2-18-2]TFC39590.1 alpha/beta hydrolase [Cryobacterium sp. TMT2-42-4]TFC61559.1 alpha/beta hydrolase [Cryobacterium sp. TMT2-18-3]TFC62983.1 alpha/beta hydrolase [Cryobacterium sp. TMT2-15-1]